MSLLLRARLPLGITVLAACSGSVESPTAAFLPGSAPSFAVAVQAVVAAPTFTPLPANPPSSLIPVVTMKTSTAGATIRYTTNGSEPVATSTDYSIPITLIGTATLKAKAFKTGMTTSSTTTATYTVVPTILRARTKNDALGQLKLWLIVDWCQSTQAFGLNQMRDADAKGGLKLAADVLQWIFTTFTPYIAKSGIERELARYANKSIAEIDTRTAELQRKAKTTDLQGAYANSWCN